MVLGALAQSPLPDSFNPGAGGGVYALAVQADGKILAGGRFTSNGLFGFNMVGPAGRTVFVEASSEINPANWAAIHTNTSGSLPIYFQDPQSGGGASKFYRLRLP